MYAQNAKGNVKKESMWCNTFGWNRSLFSFLRFCRLAAAVFFSSSSCPHSHFVHVITQMRKLITPISNRHRYIFRLQNHNHLLIFLLFWLRRFFFFCFRRIVFISFRADCKFFVSISLDAVSYRTERNWFQFYSLVFQIRFFCSFVRRNITYSMQVNNNICVTCCA